MKNLKNTSLILFLLVATTAQAKFFEGTATLNFTADSPDKARWVGLNLEGGLSVEEPKFHAPGWQLRFLQGYVSTNAGRAAKIATDDFESVAAAPTDESQYAKDTIYDPMGPAPNDTYNKTLMDWYDYFMFEGHLLAPKKFVFVVETDDGHFAKIKILDYVKNGRAIRWVKEKDFLGREKLKQRGVKVGDEDNQVHVVIQYRYNSAAGDRSLNPQ